MITQPVFDAATGRRFVAKASGLGVKTMLGILPVKREAMANYLIDRVKDLSGARQHLDRFGGMSEEEVRAVSLRENMELMKSLARDAAGFIIMSGGGPSLAIELALQFSQLAQGDRYMNRTQTNGSRSKVNAEKNGANGSGTLEDAVRVILRHIGEDPEREGLERTPARVAKAYEFLTSGYAKDPKEAINGALFSEQDYQEMILCKDLDFYSLCEHHLLPFMGKAHVAYLPNRKIVGISKLARMVEIYARRLQVQERLTTQIAQTLMSEIDPLGVAVVLEAEHLCMRMRGVEKQNSYVTTSAMLGVFRTNHETRQEFMQLLRDGKP